MQTSAQVNNVQTGGLADTGSFQIKATGKAFRILSDGLYTDKPRAVIRELSCNAFDSHVAAGVATRPFEVHLPTPLEPHLSIRDFGLGLSHDDVMKLYTTYFESTKTDSNDFIGALGLGSKSPFSYVDSFTVVSIFNGKRRTYTAFISENGVPSIALMGEDDTDEHNGLEVSMPVQSKDFSAFQAAAERTLYRFNPVPRMTGGKVEFKDLSYVMKRKTWGLRNKVGGYASTYDSAFAVQGAVAYPIDASAISDMLKDQREILNLPIDIFFNIGELEVAASREGLSYDPRTIANIKARLSYIGSELASEYQKEFDNCKTQWEALCKYESVLAPLDYNLKSAIQKNLKYKGNSITSTIVDVRIDDQQLIDPECSLVYQSAQDMERVRWKMEHSTKVRFTASDDIQFIWDDCSRRNRLQLLDQYFDKHGKPKRMVLIITSKPAVLKHIINEFGNPPYETMAKWPDVPKVPTQKNTSAMRPLYKVASTTRYTGWGNPYEEVKHDVTKGGIYLRVNNWCIVYPDSREGSHQSLSTLKEFFQLCEKAGYTNVTRDDVFFIPGTYKTIPEKHKGWELLWDNIKKQVEKDVSKKEFLDQCSVIEFNEERLPILLLIERFLKEGLWPADKTSSMYRCMQEVKRVEDIRRPAANERRRVLCKLAEFLQVEFKIPPFVTTLPEFVTTDTGSLYTDYPLLATHMRFEQVPSHQESLAAWIKYVDQQDKLRKELSK